MPLKALLFDVDGTLADTERDGHRVAFNQAFQDAGLDWDWDVPLYGELLAVTGGKERMTHYAFDVRQPPAAESVRQVIPKLHIAKNKHYAELLSHGSIPLRAGVRELLDSARAAGLRLAIATTTSPENVHALLEHVLPDGDKWFEVIGAGDVVPKKKPAGDIYVWVMEKMGLSPQDCIAFEDSENGVRSATAAGLKTVVTPNGYTHDHDFSGAALVVDGMGEVTLPVLRSLMV